VVFEDRAQQPRSRMMRIARQLVIQGLEVEHLHDFGLIQRRSRSPRNGHVDVGALGRPRPEERRGGAVGHHGVRPAREHSRHPAPFPGQKLSRHE